eukprot:TRINITY_DN6861_c0_g1_i4.p5 TRINITY_DN6861_c0_g1~~TRINITY_DN6861_c0_g1_i4.p5  ORF type:complete len:106 (+),score=4.13 TRINITY_DN6861_c0_g1_i4:709-1026(+)
MQTELKTYVRNNKNSRIGVVVAKKNAEGKVTIGWSLCRKNDEYDADYAYFKANKRQYIIDGYSFSPVNTKRKRTVDSYNGVVYVPQTIYSTVQYMIDRSKRYFKS